jgi:hypothetical protein
MGVVIGQILPTALGILLSPMGVVVVILMLITARGKVNGPAFMLGWIAGIAIIGGVVIAVAGGIDSSDDAAVPTWESLLKLALGVLLLLYGVKQWRERPHEGDAPAEPPKWMTMLDQFTPVKTVGMGILLGGINPKNLMLIIAGAVVVAQAGLSGGDDVIVWAIFTLLASLGVIIPVAMYFIMGERSRKILDGLRDWMTANNATIMAVVLLIFGVKLIGDAISGFAS